MNVALFNANGLAGKADGILNYANQNRIDLFIIVETWLCSVDSSPISHPVINLVNPVFGPITGGRRGKGGILVFCQPKWQNEVQTLVLDPNRNFLIFRLNGIIWAVGYFAPSVADQLLFDFLDLVQGMSQEYTEEVIVLGDFNSRLGIVSGDHAVNPRGTKLLNYMLEKPWQLPTPEVGKYTSFSLSNGGKGITDLVFTLNRDLVGYTVHEDNSLGGSDHRLITFHVQVNILEVGKQFDRINIRRLADREYRESYLAALARGNPIDMLHSAICLTENRVENMWRIVREWILQAARDSLGILKFSSRVNKDFWTPELQEQRDELIRLTTTAQELCGSNASPEIKRLVSSQLTARNKDFRSSLGKRKSEVFETMINNLSEPQNSGAFLRMVSCIQRRKNGSGCQLEPDALDEHINYFRSTFGGEPEPARPSNPRNLEPAEWAFSTEDIATQLKYLPKGKAAGNDGLMAELLTYGGMVVADALQLLFQAILRDTQIPEEWCRALVVPIFKKKGSAQDIANYRPISLTCVVRRVLERLIKRQLEKIGGLSDYQGGFRSKRSTHHQVFHLHEAIQCNPGIRVCYLDLKAAYDLVNRDILWDLLANRHGVPQGNINMLRALFDRNSSCLVIKGKKSEPLDNKRGLLQGSSLSPLLFNFFINTLVNALNTGHSKVKVHGRQLNCLFYADDGVLLADSLAKAQAMLSECEQWSRANGMRFSPDKCVFTSTRGTESLQLYGTNLNRVNTSRYLGYEFDANGIHWASHVSRLAAKARGIVVSLAQSGMNPSGWPGVSSIKVYKSFIRPILEYGMQLLPYRPETLKVVQGVQNLALRTMFGAHNRTSINGMHRLALLEKLTVRNSFLNAVFMGSLHNSFASDLPARKVYINAIGTRIKESCVFMLKSNPLWQRAHKRNLLMPREENEAELCTFDQTEKQAIIRDSILDLDKGNNNVAGSIVIEKTDKLRVILQPGTFTDRSHKIAILRWILGGVAMHQLCQNCHAEELSREHALDCSGAGATLERKYRLEGEGNIIDRTLNHFRNDSNRIEIYEDIFAAISIIYRKCLQYRLKVNGFWAPDHSLEGIG
jgi:hypothetical protein